MEQHGNTFDPISRIFHDVVVPVGGANIILVVEQIPIVVGTIVQCSCWVTAIDATNRDEVSSTIDEGSFRVSTGNLLLPLTKNRNNKQVTGGANTFAQDVNFAVTPNVPVGGFAPLTLFASNVVAPRTGDILVRYWINQFRGG